MLVLVVLFEKTIAVWHLLTARTRALLLEEGMDGRRKQAYWIFKGPRDKQLMVFRTRQAKGDKEWLSLLGLDNA